MGIAALLLSACLVFVPLSGYFAFSALGFSSINNWPIYLLAFIGFFFAGLRAAQQTGRVDMGGLAGFWAGLVIALVEMVIYLVLVLSRLVSSGAPGSVGVSITLMYTLFFTITWDFILALLVGTGLGAFGGFIGRAYASGIAVPPQPNQATASPPPAPPQSQP